MARRRGHYATVLKIAGKLGDGKATKGGVAELDNDMLREIKGECYEKLGWNNLKVYNEAWKLLEKPKGWALF